MASGVPVVGARAGGIPNVIVENTTGYLFEPGNAADLTAKVKKLLDDKELRQTMSLASRAEAELWDWESATSYLRNVQYRIAQVRASANPTPHLSGCAAALFRHSSLSSRLCGDPIDHRLPCVAGCGRGHCASRLAPCR